MNTILRSFGLALALIVHTALPAAQATAPIPEALAKMADAERAFARRAADTTVREAFIEFFSDESVSFEPGPGPARERLRARPAPPPTPGVQLLWEPRYGDVASSGDLGYLTGPFEQTAPGRPSRYGNYFSVWKRQANGDYRVILDVGSGTPQKPEFAAGVSRAPGVPAWRGQESRAAADASLAAADAALGKAIAAKGAADAFLTVLHAEPYFLRTGFMPMRTRDAAVTWLRANVKTLTFEPMKAETAAAGDLGYTWGKMALATTAGQSQDGYYVSVWTRKADGSWQVVANLTTPPPPG